MSRKEKLSAAARLMGLKGGPARARKLEAARRREIASAAASAKWARLGKAERRRQTEAARAARWPKKNGPVKRGPAPGHRKDTKKGRATT